MRTPISLAIALLPAMAFAFVPTVDQKTVDAAAAIHADPAMKALLADLETPEAKDARFAAHMEIVRIISPSRYELRRQAEITRRLTTDWGFDAKDIMSRTDGHLPGAGVQTVDGLPVYNVCVRIPGTYSQTPGAKNYKGQFPKVLIEGHIDTVNPPDLPPESKPYAPIKLALASDPVVKTRDELAAIQNELHFDDKGYLIKDETFQKAYKRFANLEDAQKNGGTRFYVPGYSDAMVNTAAVLQAAQMMKKHGIRPVYDVWVCGTAGEEGKGNIAGMKQLYGYSQETGKANNALNIVANLSVDSTSPGSATINYVGSYRFEIKYRETADSKPSALQAMARAIEEIAKVKTAYDKNPKVDRTTYTVGVARCTPAGKNGRSQECSLSVDMRSLDKKLLTETRALIEPQFKAALDAENEAHGLKTGDKGALAMEVVWFGDRPAAKRENLTDPIIQAHWTATKLLGIDERKELSTDAQSLNDNVPAAIGIPTINVNVGTNAASRGGHTWYEWGIPGDADAESLRVYRLILTGLLAAGFNTSDGKTVEPLVGPEGPRTTEEMYK